MHRGTLSEKVGRAEMEMMVMVLEVEVMVVAVLRVRGELMAVKRAVGRIGGAVN